MKKILKLIILIALIVLIANNIDLKKVKNDFLKKIYKTDYSTYVEKYAEEYNVDKYLIYAIIKAESNFDENAVSNKEAKGLMQLMYSTAEEIAEKIDLNITEESVMEPDININLGTKYISILIQKYENVGLALTAYNAGSGNVDKWIEENTLKKDGSDIENIPFTETNNYVRKILRDYKIYKELYN